MTNLNQDKKPVRRPLFNRVHRKRSLSRWIVPLIIILAVIFFLPRVMEILAP